MDVLRMIVSKTAGSTRTGEQAKQASMRAGAGARQCTASQPASMEPASMGAASMGAAPREEMSAASTSSGEL